MPHAVGVPPNMSADQRRGIVNLAGKLKELGNTVLNKFGMSLDNFKAEKDPSTGSYSIRFQQ